MHGKDTAVLIITKAVGGFMLVWLQTSMVSIYNGTYTSRYYGSWWHDLVDMEGIVLLPEIFRDEIEAKLAVLLFVYRLVYF